MNSQKAFAGLPLGEALERWTKWKGIGKKPGTLHYHQELVLIIRKHWLAIGQYVDTITEADCLAFTEKISHFSAPRYNGVVNCIRNITPAALCCPRRRLNIIPKNVPTLKDMEILLAALDSAPYGHAWLTIRFLAFSGLRISEATKLKWQDVREDHLYLPADITKNGKPRCVPFIPGMAEVISRLRTAKPWHPRSNRDGYVLPHRGCRKALRYACRLAGLPLFSNHTFRHYFATRAILSGVDIPTVAKWLGHSDNGALLLRVYCHLLDDHSLAMAQKVKVLAQNQDKAAIPSARAPVNIVPLIQPASAPADTLDVPELPASVGRN